MKSRKGKTKKHAFSWFWLLFTCELKMSCENKVIHEKNVSSQDFCTLFHASIICSNQQIARVSLKCFTNSHHTTSVQVITATSLTTHDLAAGCQAGMKGALSF